jgi:hypothetical protein
MLNNLGNIRMDNTTITTSIGNANLVLSTAGPGTVQVTNRLDVYGGIHGELVGNVTGRHYGPVIGSLDGPVTGDLTGNASGSANTVRAAAQPNITSLGTLTSLTVSTPILADLRGNALTANSAHQADTANTANTANIANTAVTATTATTVLTGYQPNITGVGTLNNLTVSANVVAGGVKTDHYYYANGLPFTGGTGALPPGVSVPGNATEGTFWFDTADGHIYVRYQNSWVDTSVNNSAYTPATPSDWNGTPPATLAAAIDRLAAAVKALRGGTGA